MSTTNAPSDAHSGPSRGVFNGNHKSPKGDKTNLRSMVTIWDRTEHQLRPHEGFKPEAVRRRDLHLIPEDASRTPQLAKPPAWGDRPDLPCVPLDTLGRNEWEGRWDSDAWRGSEESRAERAAKMCAGCPAIRECLADALEQEGALHHSSRYLIRGGLTPRGRARLSTDAPALGSD